MSGDFQIVQPSEVLEFYRDLAETCGYVLETAGALDSGRKVWAVAITGMNGTADKEGQDKLAAYLLAFRFSVAYLGLFCAATQIVTSLFSWRGSWPSR